jgi:endonuclease V-like protein UPF0215 family
MVLHAERNVVTGLEARISQNVRETHRALVKLGISDDFTSLGKDDCWTVGMCCCMDAWVHGLQTSE